MSWEGGVCQRGLPRGGCQLLLHVCAGGGVVSGAWCTGGGGSASWVVVLTFEVYQKGGVPARGGASLVVVPK